MRSKYNFLVVGAGLSGAVFAQQLKSRGRKVLVIDKSSHVAGNCYTQKIDGIEVHRYGAHIFHTSSDYIWKYVNQFCQFNSFINRPKVNYKGKIFSFPLNMMTFYQLWSVVTPNQARAKLAEVVERIEHPQNMEQWLLSKVGREIYEIFIKGYTIKQWQKHPQQLPSDIIKRIPIRLTYDDNYFNDRYQGIAIGGYTKMVENILKDVEVKLNVDYLKDRSYWDSICDNIFYTGRLDEFFDFRFGRLEYRGLRFEDEYLEGDFQGNAVINYTDKESAFTRIIEHKHFEMLESKNTIITREYPMDCGDKDRPYYPINTDNNQKLYEKYFCAAETIPKLVIGGRLGLYKYLDMDNAIEEALRVADYFI